MQISIRDVTKLRGVPYREGGHDFCIRTGGIEVFPRLIASEHHTAFKAQSISSGIPEFDALLEKAKAKAPARSLVSIDDVGVATAFLAHDAARLITGETLYIDGGYHIID